MRVSMGASELVELGRSRCSPGKIWRAGHDRKVKGGGTVRVRGTCIVDRGAPGKTPSGKRWAKDIPGLRKKGGFIPGWNHEDPASKRLAALKRDAMKETCTTTGKKLVVVHNLNFRTNPEVARAAQADHQRLEAQGWCRMKAK